MILMSWDIPKEKGKIGVPIKTTIVIFGLSITFQKKLIKQVNSKKYMK